MDEVERLKDAKEQEHYDYLTNRKELFRVHSLFDGFPTTGYQIDFVIEKLNEFRNQLAKREVDMEQVEVAIYDTEDPNDLSIDICWNEYETEEEYKQRIEAEMEQHREMVKEKYHYLKKVVLENYDAVCNIIDAEKIKKSGKL